MYEWLYDASAWVLPVVLAITLHEAAHGFVAERFGDDTARRAGRVTFNPIKHIDRFGTIIFPGLLMLMQAPFLFGYAKPVPVNFHRLEPPRTGMFMVAIAGVTVNLILAVIAGVLLHIEQFGITPETAPWLFMNLYRALMINCVLIVFNMLPILPLDGGRAVDALLHGQARAWFRKVERFGIPLVLAVMLLPMLLDMHPAQYIIGEPALWLVERVLWVTGNGD